MPTTKPYGGFELGPIRPPSEAYSLLLRINRGCGWNKCRFCGFYRDVPFSIRTAEDVKLDLASAVPLSDQRKVKIRGRAVNSPVPQDIDFTTAQAAEAIKEPCMAILAAIKWVLERTPPELSADIMRGGIHLTGGGAQLFGLDQYIATELGIPVLLAKEPMDCSALGLGYLVENLQLLQSIGKQGFMQVE